MSWTALSGIAVTSKFSLMRAGLTDPVRTALPRWMPHAKSTCAGVLPNRWAVETISGSSSSRGLDLDHSWLDPGGLGDPLDALDVDVREPYRSGKPFVNKAFHRCPGFR
jgi:hypothetical protein